MNLLREIVDAFRYNRAMGELSRPAQAIFACTLIGALFGLGFMLVLAILL